MSAPLTQRQEEVLDFIGNVHARTGVMPSTREIQQHFGFASQTAAVNHLRALERKGVIQRLVRKARGVAIVADLRRERIIDVPIYGQIAAGLAETIEQDSVGTISIDTVTVGLPKRAQLYALKVRGDSMVGAQIVDGDLVLFEVREPKNGDIVAALIDGETTLKRYVVARGQPYLKAENPRFTNLQPLRELMVQGVMVALVRKCGG